jgi:uncharacterized cofD-like protein
MQAPIQIDLSTDLPIMPYPRLNTTRTPLEHLMEFLLTGTLPSNAPAETEALAKQVLSFDVRNTRLVILGGGTGLSTIIGGNPQKPDWADQPNIGVKQEFPLLHSIICTTDDGGSTGKLLKMLPMIGIGDIRKILVSSINAKNLHRVYGGGETEIQVLIRFIHKLMSFRFSDQTADFEILKNPLLATSPKFRAACPQALAENLCKLGAYVSPGGSGPTIPASGNSLGNILLTSAIFMAAQGRTNRAPRLREVQTGIDHIAGLIGAPIGQFYAATSAPGQLKIRYANGVEVYGESKSALARRNYPIERISVEYAEKPLVSAAIINALKKADLIIYAPGSLYTSIIPILQLDPIASAIRANERALKILGANVWIQEGETDISLKNQERGFLISELFEAYDRNVAGGINGLFNMVVSANLEHVPMNILRNYALEGKSPILLDKAQVESMGIQPIEASLVSAEDEIKTQTIHHDAKRFTMAIRTLLYADKFLKEDDGYRLRLPKTPKACQTTPNHSAPRSIHRSPLLCNYSKSIKEVLDAKVFRPGELKDFLIELAWGNRDIAPSHFKYFKGGLIIPGDQWNRSTEWDNVLGYYDPQDQYLKFHEGLLAKPSRLREDMLVAIGESLLGRYIESRHWIYRQGARCFEIVLRPASQRESFLSDAQIHTFLKLARMSPDPLDNRTYRITINNVEGFLPPGLLFGLAYAWYLSGNGITMEYEMNLLRWPLKSLIPFHAKDWIRKNALVTFFRHDIFGHDPD